MSVYPVNLLLPLAVLLPNVLFLFIKPVRKVQSIHTNQLCTFLERLGQIGMVALPLFFAFQLNLALCLTMGIVLFFYYTVWLRYITTRKPRDLYTPLLFIPLPLATLPVIYFFLGALQFNNLFVYSAWLCFAVGHLYVSRLNALAQK